MRRVILAVTSTIAGLVLLLSFKSGSTVAQASRPRVAPAPTGTTSAAGTGDDSGAAAPTTPKAGSKTVTGDAIDTRYGPVQVQLTITNGKVTAAEAVEYPENSGRDEQINAYAVPLLNQEAVQAGTASIDMVSGATYTSDGYVQSLQSALDQGIPQPSAGHR